MGYKAGKHCGWSRYSSRRELLTKLDWCNCRGSYQCTYPCNSTTEILITSGRCAHPHPWMFSDPIMANYPFTMCCWKNNAFLRKQIVFGCKRSMHTLFILLPVLCVICCLEWNGKKWSTIRWYDVVRVVLALSVELS